MSIMSLWACRSFYCTLLSNEGAAAWRIPYGQAGVLNFFLGVVSANNIEHDLMLHTLRLIGNTCADTGTLERTSSKAYTS